MLFTVVIPIFNSASYVINSLKSIEAATKQSSYEVILVDDHSDDIDELKEKLKAFDKVRLIEKSKKTNAADSRNIGLLDSKGKYVFFLDSDDCYMSDAIDNRIEFHRKNEKGIVFGNFIVNSGDTRRKSALPEYNNENMRDYILIKKGDFRSSVISIDKEQYKGTLFDSESRKHQDWIFAFKCWDNGEKIGFDEHYSTNIIVDRSTRMSSSLNVEASKYFCENYLGKREYINHFAKNNWRSMIHNIDRDAFSFFTSTYKPQNITEHMELEFYKLIGHEKLIPYSSRAVSYLRKLKAKYEHYISV